MKPSVILMGSKPGSVVALSVLLERGWDVKYVVISKKHNYAWIGGKTIQDVANENGLKVVTQTELPKNEKADFVISYMYRYLVKPEVIGMANRAALNFHAGPLPEFGGWAFYNIAILENNTEYGCTCHYLDTNFDTGPLFKVNRFPINAKEETAYSLERKAQEEMIRLFVDFCGIAENNKELPYELQEKEKMRYLNRDEFEKLKEIPHNADAETIDRHARAFWYPPYECAYFNVGGVKVEVIPQIVKDEIAEKLHADDLDVLFSAVKNYKLKVEN
jgi:methionyl-tRNA formyltransferase